MANKTEEITPRDLFIAAALSGLSQNPDPQSDIGEDAVEIADSALAARDKSSDY